MAGFCGVRAQMRSAFKPRQQGRSYCSLKCQLIFRFYYKTWVRLNRTDAFTVHQRYEITHTQVKLIAFSHFQRWKPVGFGYVYLQELVIETLNPLYNWRLLVFYRSTHRCQFRDFWQCFSNCRYKQVSALTGRPWALFENAAINMSSLWDSRGFLGYTQFVSQTRFG